MLREAIFWLAMIGCFALLAALSGCAHRFVASECVPSMWANEWVCSPQAE